MTRKQATQGEMCVIRAKHSPRRLKLRQTFGAQAEVNGKVSGDASRANGTPISILGGRRPADSLIRNRCRSSGPPYMYIWMVYWDLEGAGRTPPRVELTPGQSH